jgi:RNA polymerase sigma-70 factor, ECF subfamily
MSTKDDETIEREVRRLLDAEDHAGAAAAAIRGRGPEILGFLAALHRNRQDADDVFSIWSERLWRGLGDFAWQCSLRTWAYAIARNASMSFLRGERRRAQKGAPPDEVSELLSRAEAAVRTETSPYLRTEVKDKFAAIRRSLSPDDEMLLVLRVDKGLEWKDIARVMSEDGMSAAVDPTKESQRLRKRFQILKGRLIEMGRQKGILGGGD